MIMVMYVMLDWTIRRPVMAIVIYVNYVVLE